MKKKNLSKKLVLSKEIITKLNDVEKNMVKGGTGVPGEISRTNFNVPTCGCGVPCDMQW